jgi:hypothetical protein
VAPRILGEMPAAAVARRTRLGQDPRRHRLPQRRQWVAQARLRSRAEEMRQDAMFQLGFIGGADPVLPEPSGSPLGDALSAVAAAAHAAITGYGFTRADLWPLLGRYGLACHLAPARAG